MLPSDFDIFALSSDKCSECSQNRAKGFPDRASDCAISFSWCGNVRSTPPAWMSSVSPKYFIAMQEHSMCQPGRPSPMAVSQDGSPSFFAFQRTKSRASSLSYSSTSIRAPARIPEKSLWESLPYSGNLEIEKYVDPSLV